MSNVHVLNADTLTIQTVSGKNIYRDYFVYGNMTDTPVLDITNK